MDRSTMAHWVAAALCFLGLAVAGCFFRGMQEAQEWLLPAGTEEQYAQWAQSMRGQTPLVSLVNLHGWARVNMTYKPDGIIDMPDAAPRTWFQKTGDCDDFSYMMLDALGLMGHGAEAWMGTIDLSHSVCIIRSNGAYWHASNWPDFYGPYPDLKSLAASVAPEWRNLTVRDRRLQVTERIVK